MPQPTPKDIAELNLHANKHYLAIEANKQERPKAPQGWELVSCKQPHDNDFATHVYKEKRSNNHVIVIIKKAEDWDWGSLENLQKTGPILAKDVAEIMRGLDNYYDFEKNETKSDVAIVMFTGCWVGGMIAGLLACKTMLPACTFECPSTKGFANYFKNNVNGFSELEPNSKIISFTGFPNDINYSRNHLGERYRIIYPYYKTGTLMDDLSSTASAQKGVIITAASLTAKVAGGMASLLGASLATGETVMTVMTQDIFSKINNLLERYINAFSSSKGFPAPESIKKVINLPDGRDDTWEKYIQKMQEELTAAIQTAKTLATGALSLTKRVVSGAYWIYNDFGGALKSIPSKMWGSGREAADLYQQVVNALEDDLNKINGRIESKLIKNRAYKVENVENFTGVWNEFLSKQTPLDAQVALQAQASATVSASSTQPTTSDASVQVQTTTSNASVQTTTSDTPVQTTTSDTPVQTTFTSRPALCYSFIVGAVVGGFIVSQIMNDEGNEASILKRFEL